MCDLAIAYRVYLEASKTAFQPPFDSAGPGHQCSEKRPLFLQGMCVVNEIGWIP